MSKKPSAPIWPQPLVISLDGEWSFCYAATVDDPANPSLPDPATYTAKMAVPAYWDDQLDRLRTTPFWPRATFNPHHRVDANTYPMNDNPPDATLPFLVGAGWYRRMIDIPADWDGGQVTLSIGGARMDAWVFVNGQRVAHHANHSIPIDVSLTEALKPGRPNELVICVSNLRQNRDGCDTRGYQGFSGGLYRPVSLHVSGPLYIADCYVYPTSNPARLQWRVQVDGTAAKGAKLDWLIRDPRDGRVAGRGSLAPDGADLAWSTPTFDLQPWSDHSPRLYQIELETWADGRLSDRRLQPFGLRRLEADGTKLRLNGQPVFLRGVCDHAYVAPSPTAPLDIQTYRLWIRRQQELGFNWLRFHTWVPSEEYMAAADELGMMLQVEPPVGFGEGEWIDIVRACRRHPSVVIYCCGNEELLDEPKIESLRRMAEICREEAPDSLFNPQEALRGVEYFYGAPPADLKVVQEPFPHVPERLDKLRAFSDVFGQYTWGLMSYLSALGDWRAVDRNLAIYGRPCLSHEIGIHGNYLNLDLEHRYAGSRIGTDLFSSVRRLLERAGLVGRAPLYYRNSCAWQRILRKHNIEMARKCHLLAGYDFLGSTDNHWHRTGYPCGVMNEFYELKPGETAADVRQYNGESVLLLDHTNQRTLDTGGAFNMDLMGSLFGRKPLARGGGAVTWTLRDARGTVLRHGHWSTPPVPLGEVTRLGAIKFTTPEAPDGQKAAKLTLAVRLAGGEYAIVNDWNFWVFPKAARKPAAKSAAAGISGYADRALGELLGRRYPELKTGGARTAGLWVVQQLDEPALEALRAGKRLVLLGSKPLSSVATDFQLSVTGRVHGNLATVIADHPAVAGFPHEGYCDWQFHNMLCGGQAIYFDNPAIPFDPIIEVVSSFKLIRKQAAVFELRVGEGRLLACSLNLRADDPAALFLLDALLKYAAGEQFAPRHAITADQLAHWCTSSVAMTVGPTDQALDVNMIERRRKAALAR